jgi:adenylate cyclase
LENEPRILADLANAYRLNGDIERAFSTVAQAIEIAIERHARVPECLARLVHADLLMRSATGDQQDAGRRELERAGELMRETGAVIFETYFKASNDEPGDTSQISTRAS